VTLYATTWAARGRETEGDCFDFRANENGTFPLVATGGRSLVAAFTPKIALLVALASCTAAAAGDRSRVAPGTAQPAHSLRICAAVDAPWGGSIRDVEAVLNSAAHELWQFFPDRSLSPILVEPKGGPIVLFDRGPKGEYRVRLNTGNRLWAQHAYQFAHEFCHILCDYRAGRDQGHRWFEESLCELASIFALRRMAETWKTRPPYPNWRDYSASLGKYAEDLVRRGQLPPDTSLAAWYRANAEALSSRADLREKNAVVAVALLPLFEQQPEHWEAVTYLYQGKPQERHETLARLLADWRRACPARHRAFVAKIAAKFEIKLLSRPSLPARKGDRAEARGSMPGRVRPAAAGGPPKAKASLLSARA